MYCHTSHACRASRKQTKTCGRTEMKMIFSCAGKGDRGAVEIIHHSKTSVYISRNDSPLFSEVFWICHRK